MKTKERMDAWVKVDVQAGVGRITLNRADKRNALTQQMLRDIHDAVVQLRSHDLRVLVLDSVGSVFCAGMDLAEMQARASSEHAEQFWLEDAQAYHDALVALVDCPVPTLAAVAGPVIAGGVGLVLACDLVVATDATSFALPEPQRGLIAAMVTPLLVRRMTTAQAGYVLLSGERLTIAEALRFGLCDQRVAPPDLETAVETRCRAILNASPQALAGTKQFLREIGDAGLHAAMARAIEISAKARMTQDAREGLAAFLEKRSPVWQSPRT